MSENHAQGASMERFALAHLAPFLSVAAARDIPRLQSLRLGSQLPQCAPSWRESKLQTISADHVNAVATG